jgi:hypothetical protein
VTRDEFEASNREIVWKALPDISIQLTLLFADGELVAARGLGQGTHAGAELFGLAPAGKHVTFTETHIYRIRGNEGLRALATSRPPGPANPAPVMKDQPARGHRENKRTIAVKRDRIGAR